MAFPEPSPTPIPSPAEAGPGLFETVGGWIGGHLSDIASLATALSALAAFIAIRQIAVTNRRQADAARRQATISLISDPQHGIPARSRPVLALMDQEVEARVQAVADAVAQPWREATTRIVRGGRFLGLSQGADAAPALIEALRSPPYLMNDSLARRDFFNVLENIGNGVYHDVLDPTVLNSMYGGYAIEMHDRNSRWLNALRRIRGWSFYDKTDFLIDTLRELRRPDAHDLNRMGLWLALALGLRFGLWRQLAEHRAEQRFWSRSALEGVLRGRSLTVRRLVLRLTARRLLSVRPIPDPSGAGAPASRIDGVVDQVLAKTCGLWPVGVAQEVDGRRVWTAADVSEWRRGWKDRWGKVLGCYQSGDGVRGLVGVVALRPLAHGAEEAAIWTRDVEAALRSLGVAAPDQADYFAAIGMPVRPDAPAQIDFDRVTIVRSLMARHDLSPMARTLRPGRRLFVEALREIHQHQNRVALLSVIADEAFSEAAVNLYRETGGHYLGLARDRGAPDGHLMHFFLF